MLLEDARILDGHFPSAEGHHARPGLEMGIVERCALEGRFAHGNVSVDHPGPGRVKAATMNDGVRGIALAPLSPGMTGMASDAALRGVRILLVEDSDDARDAFDRLLRSEGAAVVAVASGADAAIAVLRERFDVLLTDYGLPDIPGDMLIRQVLASARHRPHIVVVTGYGQPYAERARRAG